MKMDDRLKDKKQLITELKSLRKRIAEIEDLEAEPKKATTELNLLKTQMEFILDITKTWVDIIDADFNLIYVNEGIKKIYGEINGKKCYEYAKDRQEPCPNCGMVMALRTRSPVVQEQIMPKEGNRIVQNISIPFQNSEGEWLIAEVGVDISERKKVEEELRKYADELQRQNEELDAFAHTVAHDLKNPLNSITTFIQVLKKKYSEISDEKMDQYLDMISQYGWKMNNIIDELLLLASVRKAEEVGIQALDMKKILAEALKRMSYLIEKSQAEIILPGTWPNALGYGPWIEEVWVNYISNAIKYSGKPLRIEVGGTKQKDGALRFWVKDHGKGLTSEEQDQLFTPFTKIYQVSSKGSGLGLSIVRRIVEKLGGYVGVESDEGKGSVFFFTLPAPQDKTD